MELGKIKAKMREKGFNARVPVVLPGSNKIIWVVVQKNSLMEELDKVFPTKVSETGMIFNGENLTPAKGAMAAPPTPADAAPTAASIEEDEDDLLAGDADDLLADDDEDLLG